MNREAVYPGTFDPVTNGHLDIIKRALQMFDQITVAVVDKPGKDLLFTTQERIKMLRKTVGNLSKVRVERFEGLLVDYLQRRNIFVIIRGLRAVSDFEYEFQIALMNRKLNSEIESVFLMPSQEYTYLSSSLIKEVVKFGGRMDGLVPGIIEKALKKKFALTK
ncbi:pantetheine-phosphate adenylyltransferase [bacterium]|nr:pantetheine-phosphate adenylyltransferase [bacterium]